MNSVESESQSVQLHDVVVIGGSFAGLSAATALARVLKRVVVLDAGKPRNHAVAHAHNFLGHDGKTPKEILDAARTQYRAYAPYAELVSDTVTAVTAIDVSKLSGMKMGFRVSTASGKSYAGQRVILACGVQDVLPEIRGLSHYYGGGVAHCPHCAGWESRGKRLGVIHNTQGMVTVIYSRLVSELTTCKTYFCNGAQLTEEESKAITAAGYTVENAPISEILGDSESRAVTGVRLSDGRTVELDGAFVAPHTSLPDVVTQLKLELDNGPFGPSVKTPQRQETSVPGVYVAGDLCRPHQQIAHAVSDGLSAGTFAHMSMMMMK